MRLQNHTSGALAGKDMTEAAELLLRPRASKMTLRKGLSLAAEDELIATLGRCPGGEQP